MTFCSSISPLRLFFFVVLPIPRFHRDVGMRGWEGGEDGTKVMMFEVDMPHCNEDTCNWDRPAVWALNSRVR